LPARVNGLDYAFFLAGCHVFAFFEQISGGTAQFVHAVPDGCSLPERLSKQGLVAAVRPNGKVPGYAKANANSNE
jgi:hypothetical protein